MEKLEKAPKELKVSATL
jgi:hypothetical protein